MDATTISDHIHARFSSSLPSQKSCNHLFFVKLSFSNIYLELVVHTMQYVISGLITSYTLLSPLLLLSRIQPQPI